VLLAERAGRELPIERSRLGVNLLDTDGYAATERRAKLLDIAPRSSPSSWRAEPERGRAFTRGKSELA
jgi:hypothetical protein